jgi:hypothetical protein
MDRIGWRWRVGRGIIVRLERELVTLEVGEPLGGGA